MNQQKLILKIHANHLNVLNSHLLVAHLTGHFLILESLPWIGTITDRSELAMGKGSTVGLISTGHMVTLHHRPESLYLC